MDWAPGDLEQCVQATQRLGADPSLVLHGGGNSSVKTAWQDVTAREVDAIYVKGTGRDMATITADGFPPLRLERLRELLELEALSDSEMVRELAAARLDPSAPQPSVEALLHAFLPYPAVLHTHADAIVTLTNTADGEGLVREVFGDAVVVIPYVMPGFDLAREVRQLWPEQAREDTVGMVLLNHGLFTFGATAREAYEQHLELIRIARARVPRRATPDPPGLPDVPLTELADLRRAISDVAGRPMIVQRHTDADVRRFVARRDLASLATRGPLTPEHVIRTKRTPLVGRDVAAFAREYADYFARHAREGLTMLDPAPRIVLDPELGMLAAGASAAGSADRRGGLPPHDPGARGGRGRARRLRRAPARAAVRRRVLGARAGEAPDVDGAAAPDRHGRARHRRGVGNRARVRGGAGGSGRGGREPRSRPVGHRPVPRRGRH